MVSKLWRYVLECWVLCLCGSPDNIRSKKINLARGLKYLYNVEPLYPLDELQTNWIFYRGNIKHKTSVLLCGRQDESDFFCFMFLYKRSNLFKTRQMILLLFCLNKDQFWFLLMLRTSSAEVWRKKKKKFAGEIQIAQPPRQL